MRRATVVPAPARPVQGHPTSVSTSFSTRNGRKIKQRTGLAKLVLSMTISFAVLWYRIAANPWTTLVESKINNDDSNSKYHLNLTYFNDRRVHKETFSMSMRNITILSRNSQAKCRNNAIVILAQKKHATYKRDSYGLLIQSLRLIAKNYIGIDNHADNVDVFLFHTGDFDARDIEVLEPLLLSTTSSPASSSRKGILKLVNLDESNYWTLPPWHAKDNRAHWAVSDLFPVGYRHMCRWFGIKIWQFFGDMNAQLGCSYRHLLRIDEDSFIHSPISYDIFDYMKDNRFVYGYRMCAYEMDYNRFIAPWFNKWKSKTPMKREITRELCGFYNNFFVADLQFFLSPPVQTYLKALDRQGFVYRKRYGDLMIHSTAVYAFAEPESIHRFLDFTYQHVTTDHIIHPEQGCVVWGGIQAGYNDLQAEQHLDVYYKEYVLDKKCTANSTYMEEPDLSPTYQHIVLPKDKKGKVKLRTIIAGKVETPNMGILSG